MPRNYIKVGVKRKTGGRKKFPPEDQKVQISIYLRQSHVDQLGGRDKIRKLLISSVPKEIKIEKPMELNINSKYAYE